MTAVASTAAAPVTVTADGLADGWTLSVAASNLVNQATKRSIKAAQLRFGAASETTITTGDTAATMVQVQAGLAAAPEVVLQIPAGDVAGSYRADLTWTLVNGIQE